jgi:hypothetical protein
MYIFIRAEFTPKLFLPTKNMGWVYNRPFENFFFSGRVYNRPYRTGTVYIITQVVGAQYGLSQIQGYTIRVAVTTYLRAFVDISAMLVIRW